MRPSSQMQKVISGKMQPEDCDEAVQSWLRLPVYHEASRILSLPFDRRAAEIEKHKLSELVKQEVIRLHELRSKTRNSRTVGNRGRG